MTDNERELLLLIAREVSGSWHKYCRERSMADYLILAIERETADREINERE